MSVYGVTVAEGQAAHTSVRTHMHHSNLGTHLQLIKGNSSGMTLKVILPAADQFVTEQRYSERKNMYFNSNIFREFKSTSKG